MHTLTLLITSLLAFPLLFPALFINGSDGIRTWLDKRRLQHASEEDELTQMMTAYQAWENQVKQLYDQLANGHHRPDLVSHFIQVQATGEQFLAQINRTTMPALYQQTEQVYHHLKQVERQLQSNPQRYSGGTGRGKERPRAADARAAQPNHTVTLNGRIEQSQRG